MDKIDCNQDILQILATKSSTKQLVYRETIQAFQELKAVCKSVAENLNNQICDIDNHVVVDFNERGETEAIIRFSGDALVFHMHTKAYGVEDKHEVRKLSYVRDNPLNAYFGLIHVYNFLNDSLKYNRMNDVGQLIARIYVNRERHFFVEGKRQFSFLYNNLAHDFLNSENAKQIIETAMLYALDFDLKVPSFQNSKEISVFQMLNIAQEIRVRKDGELGFKTKAQLGE
jgi:hypothetical protein